MTPRLKAALVAIWEAEAHAYARLQELAWAVDGNARTARLRILAAQAFNRLQRLEGTLERTGVTLRPVSREVTLQDFHTEAHHLAHVGELLAERYLRAAQLARDAGCGALAWTVADPNAGCAAGMVVHLLALAGGVALAEAS